MKITKTMSDSRVKKRIFPLSAFLITFVLLGFFTTVQMKIIGNYIDTEKLSISYQIGIVGLWLVTAILITILLIYQIHKNYQIPLENLSDAAHKVALGDFSVYIAPNHTADQATTLDVLYGDFNKMVEELGSIETLKTDFFSNVSHEIKTPLSIIQNNAELLQKGSLNSALQEEYTHEILQATKRLSNLITNMLKLNKLEKQTIQPFPEVYDICEQIRQCAIQFEDLWEEKDIELVVLLDDFCEIEADYGLLEIVWTNLLSNAFKFTEPGGSITISQSTENERICIAVADTGSGMDKNAEAHIFDKFYQGDSSHSTEGNGLGLSLVRRILELSEGTISVESEPLKGSTFYVELPLKSFEKEQAYE